MLSSAVVVTGVGLGTSIGIGRETFWQHLLDGQSGIAPARSSNTSRYPVHLGGEIRDFEPARYLERLDPALNLLRRLRSLTTSLEEIRR